MKKSFAYPIIFMALLTAVFTFVLAFLDQSTAEKVALLQETELRKKILYVFDIDVPTDVPEEIEVLFNDHIKEEKNDDQVIFEAIENGEIKGYAFPVQGPGLWGIIDGYVGVSADYSELLGIEFISHSETPGLGGRIGEDAYKEQFRGIDISNVKTGDYVIYRPASGGNVDAIAGATLTSQSVSKLLNADIESFIKERRGE